MVRTPQLILLLALNSCVIQEDGEQRLHPATDAVLPDRFGFAYKLNKDHEYNGLNFGLVWGLDWEEWILTE